MCTENQLSDLIKRIEQQVDALTHNIERVEHFIGTDPLSQIDKTELVRKLIELEEKSKHLIQSVTSSKGNKIVGCLSSRSANSVVSLHTNFGVIKFELFTDKAPATVENFLNYVKDGFYDNTIFHRVINGFMIQGGGFTADLEQKHTGKCIRNEASNKLSNKIGTLAMARTSDPHSATCQFFINVANNDFLDFSSETSQGWGYCVFGEVVDGMDVINKIKAVSTVRKRGHADVPYDSVVIKKAVVHDSSPPTNHHSHF